MAGTPGNDDPVNLVSNETIRKQELGTFLFSFFFNPLIRKRIREKGK
jgi:hypothetical protein